MQITAREINDLTTCLNDAFDAPEDEPIFRPRTAYEGRRSYGASCVGWVAGNLTHLGMLMAFAVQVLGADRAVEMAANVEHDHMGKSDVILYFPELHLGE